MKRNNKDKFIKSLKNSHIRSFMIGMASVFCPTIIHVQPLDFNNSDSDNLAKDWSAIGADIKQSYTYASR